MASSFLCCSSLLFEGTAGGLGPSGIFGKTKGGAGPPFLPIVSVAHLPALARAALAAGIMPAMFMLSMRLRMFSMLAPVSTQAST